MRLLRRRTSGPRRDGCGFVLLTFFFSGLFLVLNSALVSRFVPPLLEAGPAFLSHPGMVQATLFMGPVVLVFLEWWLVDLVVELVSPRG